MRGLAASLSGLVFAATTAGAEGPVLSVELNKLEAQEQACQAYLVIGNATPLAFEALVLDLVMFDPDGVISKRLAVDVAPLRPGRTSVKVFSMQGVDCAGIGRLLVNDVLDCAAGAETPADCFGLIETTSRAAVEMIN